jgi:4-amino-4-deoxy-L-arabinose transferase-like glycosyltransferase
MRTLLRENAPCALISTLACAALGWLGLYGFAWNDYEVEAQPAFHALIEGHVGEFLRLAPAYGGSLVERAPFALLPGIWGGSELAVYRMVAVPCLLASAVLGVWLVARMRARRAPALARGVALAVCVANPVTLHALELGHPEELLGGCLCVAAVLLAGAPSASRGRALAAGILLGLAIANKETAVLALGPVLAVLPARRRRACLAATVCSAGAILAPLVLVSSGGFVANTRGVASTASTIFQPWQVWWFFGQHGHIVHGLFGSPKPGYRTGPPWTATISHPLILGVGALIAVAVLLRSRKRERTGGQPLSLSQGLLALSLVLLLRCLLDTWDTAYYPLPFLLALLAWEVESDSSRPPLLALCGSVLVWASFQWLPLHVSADTQSALFLAWTVPLAGLLTWCLCRGQENVRGRPLVRSPGARAATRTDARRPLAPGT